MRRGGGPGASQDRFGVGIANEFLGNEEILTSSFRRQHALHSRVSGVCTTRIWSLMAKRHQQRSRSGRKGRTQNRDFAESCNRFPLVRISLFRIVAVTAQGQPAMSSVARPLSGQPVTAAPHLRTHNFAARNLPTEGGRSCKTKRQQPQARRRARLGIKAD